MDSTTSGGRANISKIDPSYTPFIVASLTEGNIIYSTATELLLVPLTASPSRSLRPSNFSGHDGGVDVACGWSSSEDGDGDGDVTRRAKQLSNRHEAVMSINKIVM